MHTYKDDKEIIAFTNGALTPEEAAEQAQNTSETPNSGPVNATGYVVLVTDENGTVVDEVPVESGHSVTVQTGNTTSNATAGA